MKVGFLLIILLASFISFDNMIWNVFVFKIKIKKFIAFVGITSGKPSRDYNSFTRDT